MAIVVDILPLKMVLFNSYVEFPEDTVPAQMFKDKNLGAKNHFLVAPTHSKYHQNAEFRIVTKKITCSDGIGDMFKLLNKVSLYFHVCPMS